MVPLGSQLHHRAAKQIELQGTQIGRACLGSEQQGAVVSGQAIGGGGARREAAPQNTSITALMPAKPEVSTAQAT